MVVAMAHPEVEQWQLLEVGQWRELMEHVKTRVQGTNSDPSLTTIYREKKGVQDTTHC
ncbi:hypothetical protein [Moorena sp. SIO3B2]|uniref:hypothetical protein n=1 Tax=Moorena sp. SIO3B2 TaxID=2607827 RepID=UPI0013C851A4|nr:hypothetical protein [Moorena sp. SIO3B2]NEP31752.1 hypothetical protein [Moorena sp. SIO3B2]NEP31777.1 hypothetical protein [Moorena sp. SIO3B2]